MSDIPQQKSNWLAVMTIAIIVLSASGIGYYQFMYIPATQIQVIIPPPKDISSVTIAFGALDPNNTDFFIPETITIVLGINHTIVWVNNDEIIHTVSSSSGGTAFGKAALANNYIDPGASWNFTFSKPGEYDYYCTPHPYMRGLIIVLPYEDSATIATTENENH